MEHRIKIELDQTYTCYCGMKNPLVTHVEIYNSLSFDVTECKYCDNRYFTNYGILLQLHQKPQANQPSISKKKQTGKYDSISSERTPILAYIALFLFPLAALFYVMDFLVMGKDSNLAKEVRDIIPSENTASETTHRFDSDNNISMPSAQIPPSIETSSNNVRLDVKTPSKTTYLGKYTLSDRVWHRDDFTLEISPDRAWYEKNGSTKYFDIQNEGIYVREDAGAVFKYQKYYLKNKGIYLLISHTKEVRYNGVFYYRILIDGETNLAL